MSNEKFLWGYKLFLLRSQKSPSEEGRFCYLTNLKLGLNPVRLWARRFGMEPSETGALTDDLYSPVAG
jgi:hypothetical protein